MPDKMKAPEILNPDDFPLTMSDMPLVSLQQQANSMIMMGGGLKLNRLINEDAEVRIMAQTLGARMSNEEGKEVNGALNQAYYELGDLSGSRHLHAHRGNVPNPFSVCLSASRIINGKDLLSMSTASSVARRHEDAFNKEDETQRLLRFIKDTGHEDATNLSLIMEIPGMKREDLEILQSGLEYLNAGYDYKLKARELDLSTALQSSVVRTKQWQMGMKGGKIAVLTTNEKGPDGGLITLISIPDDVIMLREAQEVDEGETTKVIVERPLFAA
jgi:hypothetical protein